MIDTPERPTYGPIHAPAPEPSPAPRRRSALPWLIAAALFAFALGLLTNPWFERNVRGRLPGVSKAADPERAAEVAALQARIDSLEARAGAPAQRAVNDPPTEAAVGDGAAVATAQLAELQREVAELRARVDASAATAADGAERAQTALLIAALRRAVDAGQRFDAYAPALRARFGASHPAEVAALAALTRQPVSAAGLATSLARLAPTVERAEAEGRGWWDSLKQGFAGVIAVRRADAATAADPQAQLRAATARAAAGDVDSALRLVAALPAPAQRALAGWTAEARRYAAATQALEAIEVAALAPASPVGMPQVAPIPPAVATTF